MIAHITGTIQEVTENSLVIDVQGVGYEVATAPILLEKSKPNQKISLFVYLYMRENAIELYGFRLLEEKTFFKQLISVSGIGPKSALMVLSLTSLVELKKAIVHGDASLLTKVSGIGKKTAERLVVELKSKLEKSDSDTLGASADIEGDSQAIDGLVALGYSLKEAREAIQQVSPDIKGAQQRIGAALKLLGK